MHARATITSKGQVTIPKRIREALKTRTIEFAIENDTVIIRPVGSVGGSLRGYARGDEAGFEAVRESVWDEVVREKRRRP